MTTPDPDLPEGPIPLAEAFRRVMADVDPIRKEKVGKAGGSETYKFRGIDDVMNALHGVLARHGLIILPQVRERVPEKREAQSGRSINVVHLKVRFRFFGPQGPTEPGIDRFYVETWGEGQDSGDKATGKAHSMAMKTAMLEAFQIPTEDLEDADHGAEPAAQVVEWPHEAHWRAAVDAATTVEAVQGLVERARAAAANAPTAQKQRLKDHSDERLRVLKEQAATAEQIAIPEPATS